MISLCHALPLLIADRIPEGDVHWQSFLLRLKVSCIILSRKITPETITYMSDLIEEKFDALSYFLPRCQNITHNVLPVALSITDGAYWPSHQFMDYAS